MKFFLLNPGGLVVPAKLLPAINCARAKTWLMRISLAYTVLLATTIHLLANTGGNGQSIEKEMVTIELQNDNLEAMVKKIEAQSSLRFIYLPEQLVKYEPVSISKAKRSIKETLDLALTGTALQYEQSGRYIVLNEKKKEEAVVENKPFFVASLVKGRVTDKDGQAMAGVNVVIKGTTNGTATDGNGEYAIVAEANDVLVFSFIGFKTMEVGVNSRTVVDMGLEADVAALNEVVVKAGYYDVKRREMTCNIGRITKDDIQKQPVSNPLAALQGRIPGIEITQQTGVPGGNFIVRIRGQNSIGKGNDPLYIVDGVPFTSSSLSSVETAGELLGDPLSGGGTSPFNYISPNDIESIEVLKDADATAIYGSRGANGVILITTKKGQQGRTNVNLKFYTGIGRVNSKIKMLNTSQYIKMRKEAFENDGLSPDATNAPDLLVWDQNRYTDWKKVLIGGNANTLDAQLSVSGGEKLTQFSMGGGYHRESTVFPGSNSDQRISTHMSVNNASANQRFKSTLSINYSILNSNLLPRDLTRDALAYAPNAPALYDQEGNLNWDPTIWNSSNPHPLSYLRREYDAITNNLIGNMSLSYSLLDNLELKTSVGYTSVNNKATNTYPISSYDPSIALLQNSTFFSINDFRNWIIEPQITWKKKVGSGMLNFLVGSSLLEQIMEGGTSYATGFASEALMKVSGAASMISGSSSTYSQYKYNAIFGRVNYVLNERYILNFTGRRDGSSRFGPGKRFSNFGALGVGWIFSSEKFVPKSILSFGKLRASYGMTGNDQLGDYEYLDAYTSEGSYQNVVGLRPTRLNNPNFSWEKNRKMEVGLELGFIDDHVSVELSYYRNISSNQLIDLSLPPNTGFASIQTNFPATVLNTGLEVGINTINVDESSFKWSTSLNFTMPRNKLVDFPNLKTSVQYANTLEINRPLKILKTYEYLGVDKETGLYRFKDVNEDGLYDVNDKTSIHFVGQNFYGGIQNSFQYKGFQLDVLLQFVKQTGYDAMGASWYAPGASAVNQFTSVLSRWESGKPNNNDVQRFGVTSPVQIAYSLLGGSDRYVVDASYVRLKSFSISYTFPRRWLDRLSMEDLRLFVLGQNLFTISGYRGIDPETQIQVLPPLRVVTCGISITL